MLNITSGFLHSKLLFNIEHRFQLWRSIALKTRTLGEDNLFWFELDRFLGLESVILLHVIPVSYRGRPFIVQIYRFNGLFGHSLLCDEVLLAL